MAMSTTPALFYGGCAPVIPMTYTTTPTYGYDGYAPATNLVCSGCPYPCCNLHQLQSHQPRPPSHLISQQHQWSPPSHGDHLFPPAGSFAPPPPPQQQWGPQLHGDHLPPPPSSFAPPSHHYYHTQYYHPQQLNQDWGAQSRQAATWDLEVGKEISREEDHHFEPARQLFDETPDRKAEAKFQVDEQATPVATVSFVLEVGNGISIDKRCCQSETARQVFAEMPQPKSEAQVLEGSFGWELGQNSADDGMHFEASGGIFHTDVQCDGCGSHPIVGPRFKSTVKDDYDLCCICFSSVDDESEYIRIDHPVSYPLDEKNDEDDDIRPITFSGKKKNSSKACKKSGGNSFSTALLENEDDANDTISKPTTVVDGTVEDEEESMITYTGKKKSSKKRGKGNGMSAALVESAESTGLIEPEQPATTALLSDGVSEAAQIYCELVGLGANMKDIDIGGGLGIDYDRTSIDVLKKDGLMATHDEDTENFFNDTEVNCVLCPCNPDDNERIVPGGDAALVHLSTCVPAIKDKLEDADEELGEGCSDSTRPVRLHVSDGSVMEANHVIVIVSLGVLKAAIHQESEMFSPPLPFYKVDAISRLGIGVVNKLFLQLSRSSHVVKGQGFFSKFPFLQMVFRRQDSELRLKKIPWWMRKTASVCPLHHSTSVLLYWVAGKETLELKSLSDDEIIDGVATPIDNFMKDSHKNEEIRKDANTMAQLFQSNPDLASVILGNDLNKLQEVLRQIHRQKVEHQRQQEEENALHFADPFDVEAQKKIEAAIRQKGIDENWVAALEHNPEAFARVVMLCVDMEETLKKHVEINHACKVLKSDARLVAHGKHDFEQKLHAIGMVSDIGHYKSIVAGTKLIGSCNYFTNGKLDDQQYVVQCENVNDDKEIVIHLAYGENEDMYIKNIHVTIIRGKNEEVVEDGSCGHTIDLVGLDQLSTKNAILAACSHSRLVDTIIDIFNSMAGKYEMDAAGLNTSSLDDETFKLETAQDQCILRLIDYAKQSSSYGEDQNSRYGGSSNFGGYDFRRSQNHYGSGSYGYGGSPVGMAATPFHGASGFYVADSYAYASYNGASYNGGESSVVDYAGSAAYGGTYWNSYVDDSTSYNGASYNGCVTDAVGTAGSMTLEEGLLNDNICEVFFILIAQRNVDNNMIVVTIFVDLHEGIEKRAQA